jgi:hypothetical protein
MKDADMSLLDRIEAALARVRNRQGLMRIPVEATDMDVVVWDCRKEITRLRAELAKANAERDEAVREAAEARQTIFQLRNKLAACCGSGGAGAHTAGPTETFIPEAL